MESTICHKWNTIFKQNVQILEFRPYEFVQIYQHVVQILLNNVWRDFKRVILAWTMVTKMGNITFWWMLRTYKTLQLCKYLMLELRSIIYRLLEVNGMLLNPLQMSRKIINVYVNATKIFQINFSLPNRECRCIVHKRSGIPLAFNCFFFKTQAEMKSFRFSVHV